MPAHPQSSDDFPLHRIKRHALWLLVAFFAALSYFTARNLIEKIEERNNARMIRVWTSASISFNRLIHELQKERGLSSGFIASGGTSFLPELAAQKRRTDATIERLQEEWRETPPPAGVLIDAAAQTNADLAGLNSLRTATEQLHLSRDAVVSHYTDLIAPIFDRLLATMSIGRADWVFRQQMAFIFFLQAKEMAGQERALLAAILSANDFSIARMAALSRIEAIAATRSEKFLQLATPKALAAYQELTGKPSFREVDRIRKLVFAVGSSQQSPQITMPPPGRWFALASQKIDALNGFEALLSAQLLESAEALEAETEAVLGINAVTVMASFLLAFVLLLQIWRGKEVAEERLHLAAAVFGNSVEAILIADADSHIVETNNAFTRITGYSREEVLGQHPRLLKSGRHDRNFYAAMWEKIARTGSWEGEIWNRRKNGDIYPALLSIVAEKDRKGDVAHYIAMIFDLTKYKETEALLEQLRTFDPLTGLPNRDALNSTLDQAISRARSNGGHFALLDIGLDRFKLINDSLGHATGDLVLMAAAESIRSTLRRHDVAGRAGGDRFCIILPDMIDPRDLGAFCERLLASFAQPLEAAEQRLQLSISVGVAVFPTDGDCIGALLQNAENALYSAKEEGRGCYKFYSTEMNAAGTQLLLLEQMMRQALSRQEFSVVYQPQVDASSGQLVGAEALLRWNNAELGMVSPVQFIPVAEATGMIVPIGEWVLREACAQAKKWQDTFGVSFRMGVNLSARQFRRSELRKSVATVLSDTGLAAELLELEITEGLLMSDPAGAAAIMQGLREMGVKIALDDFGTGYSSLGYLKTFPLDRLKLDRAFVKDLPDDENDRAISRAVIALGANLGLEVLAEGVETEAQAEFLRVTGCHVFQGYFFGRPMNPAQFEEALLAGIQPSPSSVPASGRYSQPTQPV